MLFSPFTRKGKNVCNGRGSGFPIVPGSAAFLSIKGTL